MSLLDSLTRVLSPFIRRVCLSSFRIPEVDETWYQLIPCQWALSRPYQASNRPHQNNNHINHINHHIEPWDAESSKDEPWRWTSKR